MAALRDHIAKSKHNEDFYDKVKENLNSFIDWQIISLFYSLVHLVEAYAHKMGISLYGHKKRNRFVNRLLTNVSSEYHVLYSRSVIVRYRDCTNCNHLKNELNNILYPDFIKVRDTIRSLIN